MIGELVYTSAPAGLRPGTSGFCTVAATKGLSKRDQLTLESLSGYEFAFGLSDPRAKDNPPSFVHTILTSGGSTRRVLSRVGFAGADHTGRSNKIAHHLLLAPGKEPADGPAAVAQQLGGEAGWFMRWSGPPRDLDPRQLEALVDGGVARTTSVGCWAKQTGDAGWAGALARAFREQPARPAFVIFDAGTDILGLFAESLAVLREDERWRVCFSTYFSGSLPPDTPCHWRGVLAGSGATALCGRFPDATVIDLTKGLAAPADDVFSVAARKGTTVASPVTLSSPIAAPATKTKKKKSRSSEPVELRLEVLPSNPGKTTWWSGRSIAEAAAKDRAERPPAANPLPYVVAALLVAGLLVAVALMSGRSVESPSVASPHVSLIAPPPSATESESARTGSTDTPAQVPTATESAPAVVPTTDPRIDATPEPDPAPISTSTATVSARSVGLKKVARPEHWAASSSIIPARWGEKSWEWPLESSCEDWQLIELPLGRYVRAMQQASSVQLEIYTSRDYKPLGRLSMQRRGSDLLLILEPHSTVEHQQVVELMAFELVSATAPLESFTCVVTERRGSREVRIGLVDENALTWPEPLRYPRPRDVVPGNVAGTAPITWPPAMLRIGGRPPVVAGEPGVDLGPLKVKIKEADPDHEPITNVQLALRHSRSSYLEHVNDWSPGRSASRDDGIARIATAIVAEHRQLATAVRDAEAELARAGQITDPQTKKEARRKAQDDLDDCNRLLLAQQSRYGALQEWLTHFAMCAEQLNGLEVSLLDPWGLPIDTVVLRWESRNLEQLLAPDAGNARGESR